MISPLFSTFLPSTISVGMAFLPPIAAVRARRSVLRDPAGQVALCWLVMALAGFAQFVGLLLKPGTAIPVSFLVTALFPLLLLPPTLTWIGGSAKRAQWAILAVWAVVWVAAIVTLRDLRPFNLVVDPVMSSGLAVASALALAAQVRRAPARLLQADWFWILVAHVVYFVTMMLRMPIIETLVAHHWAASLEVHNGIMLLYSVLYVMIARGMLLRVSDERGRAGFPASLTQIA